MNARSVTWRGVVVGSCLLAVSLSGCGGGGSSGTRYYEDFTMVWDADTHTMSVVQSAEPRYVEGTYVRLESYMVEWNSDTKQLSGVVWVGNIHSSVSLYSPQASIISYDPSDQSITDDGPWSHGLRLDPGWGSYQWWTFTDPNGVDFSFTVRVSFTIG